VSERGFDQASETAEAIRSRCGAAPEVAIVLGSGLGDFATTLGDGVRFPYTELPHWPRSTVVGHAGLLVVGKTVVHNNQCPKLAEDLSNWGYRSIEVELDEFLKAGGSAKCLTLRTDGEEAAAW